MPDSVTIRFTFGRSWFFFFKWVGQCAGPAAACGLAHRAVNDTRRRDFAVLIWPRTKKKFAVPAF